MIFEWIFLKYIIGFSQFERNIAWSMMKQNLKTKITIDFYQLIVKFGLFSSPTMGNDIWGKLVCLSIEGFF